MVIACLDTIINLPELIVVIVTTSLEGQEASLNYPHISWKNVHDGAGGLLPGSSLSTILQTPASTWSSGPGATWSVFSVKWNEWLYVLQAVVFFSVFGTTPEMRQYYWSALWFIPKRCGNRRRHVSEVEMLPDISFNSNPAPGIQNGRTGRRRGSLSFLETTIETRSAGVAHAGEVGVISSHNTIQVASSVAGDQCQMSGRN